MKNNIKITEDEIPSLTDRISATFFSNSAIPAIIARIQDKGQNSNNFVGI
jgi:hypothetical protein